MLTVLSLYACMKGRHSKTLKAVFKNPVSGTINWDDIESLLKAAGCNVIEGDGSRVRFERDGVIASFHRPHPAKEAKFYQVRDARDYLTKLGVEP